MVPTHCKGKRSPMLQRLDNNGEVFYVRGKGYCIYRQGIPIRYFQDETEFVRYLIEQNGGREDAS
jgi:hypothetical protein